MFELTFIFSNDENRSKFELLHINAFDVQKILFNIKATGADDIQLRYPKVTHSIVGHILTSVINLHINT